MPEKETVRRARADKREGKSPSTQAGEFVHEEIRHVRQGKHGARSTKQAIAIGLSKARRAGARRQAEPPRREKPRARESAAAPDGAVELQPSGPLTSTGDELTNEASEQRLERLAVQLESRLRGRPGQLVTA